jgi:type I restriction enzyme S subunit
MEQGTIVRWLEQHAVGTTMLNLSAGIVSELPLKFPMPVAQQRIANILSAYDDLIENNRRRMALLEDAARQLYREWFVRLRFPGHEHTRIVNGVPEAWDTHSLDDVCSIGRGASPRPIAAFMDGEVPWFKIGDATASESPFIFRTQEHVTDDGAKKSVVLQPGALILSNSATCGIPYFTAVVGCVHDGWLHFADFKRVSKYFLYCFLWFKREELVSSVGDGSTQKNLNTAAVGRLQLTLPRSNSLLNQFDEAVAPMFAMIVNLATQNQALRAARDLLLPRLMSGEISV